MKKMIVVALALSLSAVKAQEIRTARLGLELVVSGLSAPVGLVHSGDGTRRLFVIEQRGVIRIVRDAILQPQAFLDLRDRVACCGEQGLLGLAFDPQFSTNGFFFVNYTDRAGDTRVERYRVRADDPDRADIASVALVLAVDQPFSNHNGGHLVFGPDGYLYIGLGDGGSGGDPSNRAQDLGTLLGKMLRIDVRSGLPYSVPADNPFAGVNGARPEIWARGLRNPWRYSFDRDTGDLWIADVGQNAWEEVNFQRAASRGGENYGWRRMEGTHCFNPSSGCDDGTLTLPVLEYGRDDGCSVTGGFRYRGARFPAMRGVYIYGDYCSGLIRGAMPGVTGFSDVLELRSGLSISSFGEDQSGEIYVVSHDGTIYRLVDTAGTRRRPVRRNG